MIPETRLLRYFVAVAEELNFTRAAARLHVAQQALSAQVRRLEREMGVELFRRTTRRVELTPAGEVLLEDARRVLKEAERAVERARRAAQGETGVLRLGYTLTAAYEALPRLVDELRARVPDLDVSVREFFSSELLTAVAEGQFDVGLAREPTPLGGLQELLIRREPFVAALSHDHPLAAETAIPLAALEEETLAIWPRDLTPGYYDALLGAFERAVVAPEVDHTPVGATIWNEIAKGRMVSLVVESLENQRPRGVALVPLEPPVPRVGLSVVWEAENASPPVARFLEVAREVSEIEGWLGPV